MTLETLSPDSVGDSAPIDDEVRTALAGDYVYKVWGGDWCVDCQTQLPAFATALQAAGIPDGQIEHYPVTKGPDGKEGPGVDDYDIELIPTVVVETPDGTEVARFVEEEDEPIATYLARKVAAIDVPA